MVKTLEQYLFNHHKELPQQSIDMASIHHRGAFPVWRGPPPAISPRLSVERESGERGDRLVLGRGSFTAGCSYPKNPPLNTHNHAGNSREVSTCGKRLTDESAVSESGSVCLCSGGDIFPLPPQWSI